MIEDISSISASQQLNMSISQVETIKFNNCETEEKSQKSNLDNLEERYQRPKIVNYSEKDSIKVDSIKVIKLNHVKDSESKDIIEDNED